MYKTFFKTFLLSAMLILTACASHPKNEQDPLESFNRKMYAFNKWFDERFFRPVAVTYSIILPPPVRKSVTNFFNNVDELPTIINSLLQGEGKQAGNSATRLIINSTLGIAGLFDPATKMGYERNSNGLGRTFYRWGWENSTYLFVPLVGPSNPRDFIGLLGNLYMTPWPYFDDTVEWSAVVIMGIDLRSHLLESEGLLGVAAIDEYSFVRDAYLQHRMAYLAGEAPPDTWVEDNEEWLFDNVPINEQQ